MKFLQSGAKIMTHFEQVDGWEKMSNLTGVLGCYILYFSTTTTTTTTTLLSVVDLRCR